MSVATKDGAWISLTKVTRLDCSKCGQSYLSTMYPTNDREDDELIREHAKLHGGVDRGR